MASMTSSLNFSGDFEDYAYQFVHGVEDKEKDKEKEKEEEEEEEEGSSLRYTVDFPLLQIALVGHLEEGEEERERRERRERRQGEEEEEEEGYKKFGTIEEMMKGAMELLQVAQRQGHEGRCEMLQMFLATLASIVGQANRMSTEVFSPAQLEIHYPKNEPSAPLPFSPSSPPSPLSPSPLSPPSSPSSPSPSPSSPLSPSSSSSLSPPSLPQSCPICFEDYSPPYMRTLMSCGVHFTCKDCMEMHLTTLVSEVGTVQKLHCPDPSCPHMANEWELEQLIGTQNFRKYLDMMALVALKPVEGEGGVWWCPNKECGSPIAKEDLGEIKKVICPACQAPFCGECGKDWHENSTCEEAGKMRESSTFASWLEKKGDKVKPCPKCKFGIEKNSGCNHMTCQQCQYQWCWLCGLPYLDEERYPNGHYGLGSPCNELRMTDADTVEEAYEKESKTKQIVDQEVVNFQNEWAAGAAERERQAEEYRRIMRRNRIRMAPILVARGARSVIRAPIRIVRSLHDG